jgi:hypothetical protein
MGERVGAISFTARTFQSMLSADGDAFKNIAHPGVRRWLRDWFYGPIDRGSNVTARVGVAKNVHSNPKTNHERMVFTPVKRSSARYDDADVVSFKRWYGRLGNRVRIVTMMLEDALVRGCHVRILDDMLPGWRSESTFFASTQIDGLRSKHARRRRKLSGRRWNDTYLESHSKDTLRQQNGFADDRMSIAVDGSIVTDATSHYFETNTTHAFGRACESVGDDMLAVHVRAGDIVSGSYSRWTGNFVAKEPSKHTTYGPFPTSYYASVQSYASESQPPLRCVAPPSAPPLVSAASPPRTRRRRTIRRLASTAVSASSFRTPCARRRPWFDVSTQYINSCACAAIGSARRRVLSDALGFFSNRISVPVASA